jgi:hypothetical protein
MFSGSIVDFMFLGKVSRRLSGCIPEQPAEVADIIVSQTVGYIFYGRKW